MLHLDKAETFGQGGGSCLTALVGFENGFHSTRVALKRYIET